MIAIIIIKKQREADFASAMQVELITIVNIENPHDIIGKFMLQLKIQLTHAKHIQRDRGESFL